MFNAHHAHGARDIAQIRTRQLVTGRPGGKHPRHGIPRFQKFLGMLVQPDVIHISQIVFRSEPVGRIPKPSHHKHQGHDGGHAEPQPHSAPEGGNADQNDQRHHREHVTRQFRAANHRHGDNIRYNHREHGELSVQSDAWTFTACSRSGGSHMANSAARVSIRR